MVFSLVGLYNMDPIVFDAPSRDIFSFLELFQVWRSVRNYAGKYEVKPINDKSLAQNWLCNITLAWEALLWWLFTDLDSQKRGNDILLGRPVHIPNRSHGISLSPSIKTIAYCLKTNEFSNKTYITESWLSQFWQIKISSNPIGVISRQLTTRFLCGTTMSILTKMLQIGLLPTPVFFVDLSCYSKFDLSMFEKPTWTSSQLLHERYILYCNVK